MAYVIKHNLAGDHVATMSSGKLLGRTTSGAGLVEEVAGINVTSSNWLGLGVTPSAWHSDYSGVEAGRVGNAIAFAETDGLLRLTANLYVNSTPAWIYANNGDGGLLDISEVLTFYNAPSGTAGNGATLTQRFYIDAVGTAFTFGSGAGYFCEDRTSGTDFGGLYHDSNATWLYNSNYGGSGFLSGDASGTITIPAGQIKFPAAQNASTNVNTLDDYEEGDWTPSIAGDSGSGVTYSVQSGRYTKIGKFVTLRAQIGLTSKGTVAGNVYLNGLPFATTADGNDVRAGGYIPYSNITSPGSNPIVLFGVGESSSSAYLIYNGANLLQWSSLTNTSNFWLTFTYEASA